MAVAIGSGTSARNLTPGVYSSAVTSPSWTISGSDLAIVIFLGTDADVTSPSFTWSLGSSSVDLIKKQADNDGADQFQWAYVIRAPTAGTGTFQMTLSGTPNFQCSAIYFTGVHQTTPAPTGDAFGSNTVNPGPWTLSPTNVGANDAMAGCHVHTQTGDSNGWTTGTLSYESNTTAVNLLSGYRLGASGMVAANETAGGDHITNIGIRLQAAAASGTTYTKAGSGIIG